MILTTKKCSRCHEEKAIEHFRKRGGDRSGFQAYCLNCSSVANSTWHKMNRDKANATDMRWEKTNREKRRAQARKRQPQKTVTHRKWVEKNREKMNFVWFRSAIKRRYGMSVEQYDAMLVEQNGLCAICSKPSREGRRLSVDHCHATKVIRGLLCHVCNQGIGYFYDDPELLIVAADYLRRARRTDGK